MNHQIIYKLQDIFNLLPDINADDFVEAMMVKTNDQMLSIYVASLIRSVIALHSLIGNKLTNRDAEKKENLAGRQKELEKEMKEKEKLKDGPVDEKAKEAEKMDDS